MLWLSFGLLHQMCITMWNVYRLLEGFEFKLQVLLAWLFRMIALVNLISIVDISNRIFTGRVSVYAKSA